MYQAVLKNFKTGFTKNKIYLVAKDYYDTQTMLSWFIIKRDDGERTLIHKNELIIIGNINIGS